MKKAIAVIALLIPLAAILMTGDSSSRSLTSEDLAADRIEDAIDQARFAQVPLLDVQVDFPRATADAERRLLELSTATPEPRVLRALADTQVSLRKFDEAAGTMQRLADIHPDKEKGLEELAEFQRSRLEPAEQTRTLLRLAELRQGDKKVETLRQALNVIKSHLLGDFDRVDLTRKMVAAKPDDPSLARELISHLVEAGRQREALTEADAALKRFPDEKRSLMALKADILVGMDRKDEAAAVYRIAYHPVDDLELFQEYLALLGKIDRAEDYANDLLRKARLGRLDEEERAEHLLLLRSRREYDKAAEAIDSWVASIDRLSASRLALFADAYESAGQREQAWRMAYAHYVQARSPEDKEKGLLKLFNLTWDVDGSTINLTGRGLLTYFNRGSFDTNPGIVGGALSLLYNTQDIDWKLSDLRKASSDFENRKLLLRIFGDFRASFPESPLATRFYERLVRMFNDYNRPKTALEYADEFMDRYPESDRFYDVAEEAVAANRRLGREDAARGVYETLMRRADRRGERDTYLKYLSSLIQSHVAKRDYTGAIEQYWKEIDAHPRDEVLFERFLSFLNSYNIYEEELKVYQRAIENFDDRDYYNKLARWYIRHKRDADFQELTRRVADIFSESELSGFLGEFLQRGRNVSDPDTVFYRTMHEYANRRFPRNMRFVESLLDLYRRFENWTEFDSLSKRYFYASGSIRQDWLKSLSRRRLLDETASRLPGGATLPDTLENRAALPELPESPAEQLLLAEIARYNCYFEAAMPIYERLAAELPSEEALLSELANLKRSFGAADGAESLYSKLAEMHPLNKAYPTKAGEVAIEKGDADRAGRYWKSIIEIEPAAEDLYLEVASIFWDYYQFDAAADVLLTGRSRLGAPALYGSKLAAVYESAKDYAKAVAEYVRTTALKWDTYWEREEPLRRLVYLARNKGMAQQVNTAFQAAAAAETKDLRYLQAYAHYLREMNDNERRDRLLVEAIDRYDNRRALDWLATQFRTEGKADAEERVLRRIISKFGEDTGTLMALSQFYERTRRLDEAEASLARRIALTKTAEPETLPRYLASLDEAAQFAWRHDRFDKALGWWREAADAASGWEKNRRLFQLSQRLIQCEKYDQAAAALEILLAENPSETDYFNTLAKIYGNREDYPGLAGLYRRALEAVRADASLAADAKEYRIAELRRGLIDNLVKLGDFTAALDQYIEIINAAYDSDAVIATAYRFAAKHGLTERLIDYYKTTGERSFKDFRWSYVRARLAEQQNNLGEAVAQWRSAVRNEPQRIELRLALADDLLKQQAFADAVDVYREVYRLDRLNTSWLRTIAQTQARAGDLEAAKATLEGILEGEPPAYGRYFEVARVFESWGELEAASEKMAAGLAKLRADIYKERLSAEDLDLFVRVGVKLGKPLETFNALLDINSLYTREATRSGNPEAWAARQGQQLTYDAFSGSFANELLEYAGDAQRRQIADRLQGYLNDFPDNSGTVAFVLSTAEKMGFASVTESAIKLNLKLWNNYDNRYNYRGALISALQYYGARGRWREAASTLERELNTSTMFHFRDEMLSLLCDLYCYGGDAKGEREALRRYWKDTGGSELRLDRSDSRIERYLDLLLADGNDAEVREVARTINAYTGQVVNYFLSRGKPQLAAAVVDAASLRRTPKWRDTKKLLIRAYAADPTADLGPHTGAEELMGVAPIGDLLDAMPDTDRVLVGDEWFAFSRHLAEYLLKTTGDKRYRQYVIGLAEGEPRSAEMQRGVAGWYAGHELFDDARRHFELALQLPGDRGSTYAELGEMLVKQGDKDSALAAWAKIVEESESVGAYSAYFDVLSRNGFARRAADKTLDYLTRTFQYAYDWDRRDLLMTVALKLNEEKLSSLVAAAAVKIAGRLEDAIEFLEFCTGNLELPVQEKLVLHGELIRQAEKQAASTAQEDEYGGAGSVLRYWLEQAIEFAVDNAQFQSARAWINAYEARNFQEDPSWEFQADGHYWQLKARTLLALGEEAAAREALGKIWQTETPDISNYRIAADILRDAGKVREAEDLLIDYYQWALAEGWESDSNYTGLAAVYLDRAGRAAGEAAKSFVEESLSLLDRMVNKRAENAAAMRSAAELLEGRKMYAEALSHRRALERLDPRDWENMLNLAVDLTRADKREEAAGVVRYLLLTDVAPLSIKLEARPLLVDLFSDKPEAAARELDLFAQRKDGSEVYSLLHADMALMTGRSDLFDSGVAAGLGALLEPALLFARRADKRLGDGDIEGAIADLKESLRIKPDAATRLPLLDALLKAGRRSEALQLVRDFASAGYIPYDAGDIGRLLGIEGRELLDKLEVLAAAALADRLFDIAYFLESRRLELAEELKVDISDRLEEIEKMRREAQLPEPPVRLVDDIEN